ncbi:MAG: hypothetical protein CMJ30_00200 [Phycisphaerae bacterium]|nr:hypothetical protein [Phycisphaerae bacterium]
MFDPLLARSLESCYSVPSHHFQGETACGPLSLTSERSEAARMWTDQNGMHNVILVRSTLGQQLHSLLSLDILVMPNFNFCFKI